MTKPPASSSSLRRRWRHLTDHAERGAASVELVLAVPALLLMLGLTIQAGLWMHATHIAQSAASRAVEAARAEDGSPADGRAAGHEALRALAGNTLHDTTVTVTRTPTDTHATITGTAPTVIPGLTWHVHATATGPTERVVPDDAAHDAPSNEGR